MDPALIADSETVARFLTAKRHFSSERGEPTYRAFEPMFEEALSRHETSVFRVSGRTPVQIRHLGEAHVAPKRGTILGRAELAVGTIRDLRLDAVGAEPPDGHAVVVLWPERKEDRKDLSIALAQNSHLVLAAAP